MIRFEYDDGGRAAAGFRGPASDCVARSAAIATGRPYREVYDLITEHAARERPRDGRRSSPRRGVFNPTTRRVMTELGGVWTPTMSIGSGTRVHLRAAELPPGRIVARCSRHLVAVIDGTLHDTYDCSRDGTRCVYGYWIF